MDKEVNWDALLADHPIFLSKDAAGLSGKPDASLELSLSSLSLLKPDTDQTEQPATSARRQVMAIKDSELIVAFRNEIRMTSLADHKLGRTTGKSYKILHTPNVQFEIRQMVLNGPAKLLAVAGTHQVAVIVLPRAGFTKLVPTTVDCKSLPVGQFYHNTDDSAPIAKIEWHPWGEGATTLMVMTTDGKLREYDISMDAEEPQQVLSFVPDKKKNSFLAEDDSEREVVSFSLGKGRADWGPLSIYAIMRGGDIYAICPYMPKNASIPSSYVHSLECFVAAKQEFLSKSDESSSSTSLSTLYDFQHKFVNALVKQLPPGTSFPSVSRSIPMRPPTTIKSPPLRQGPFLLQPAPRNLEDSEGGDATDILYVAFGSDVQESIEGETERLGVLLTSYQDGRVDVCLDVEKVEAKWEQKEHSNHDLPMFAVYETIDLGIVHTLSKLTASSNESFLDLIKANHPTFFADPIHDDTIYVYHAFGVHALQLESLLRSLALALQNDNEELATALQSSKTTDVRPILSTFSVERRCSSPIIGVFVPNDVYLTYSIFILTSAMRPTVFPLNLRSETPYPTVTELPLVSQRSPSPNPASTNVPPQYVSILGPEPWTIPSAIDRSSGLPSNPRLSLPPDAKANGEFMLTPDTLRYFESTVERISTQIRDVGLANQETESRARMQMTEVSRQRATCKQMLDLLESLKRQGQTKTLEKVEKVRESQRNLMVRLDRTLQSLMQKASPDLSENETKWFEELRRMKEEVVGASKYDDRSMAYRAKLMRHEVDRLLPQLKEFKEKERSHKRRFAERETLGASQAFELGKRSNEERNRISDLEDEIVKLAARLDLSLGQPPALKGLP